MFKNICFGVIFCTLDFDQFNCRNFFYAICIIALYCFLIDIKIIFFIYFLHSKVLIASMQWSIMNQMISL